MAVGQETVHRFQALHTPYGQVELLTPTDCVKDRLSSFFYWHDKQALEQAVMVFQDQKVDINELKRWAKAENQQEAFREFTKTLKNASA